MLCSGAAVVEEVEEEEIGMSAGGNGERCPDAKSGDAAGFCESEEEKLVEESDCINNEQKKWDCP